MNPKKLNRIVKEDYVYTGRPTETKFSQFVIMKLS